MQPQSREVGVIFPTIEPELEVATDGVRPPVPVYRGDLNGPLYGVTITHRPLDVAADRDRRQPRIAILG